MVRPVLLPVVDVHGALAQPGDSLRFEACAPKVLFVDGAQYVTHSSNPPKQGPRGGSNVVPFGG